MGRCVFITKATDAHPSGSASVNLEWRRRETENFEGYMHGRKHKPQIKINVKWTIALNQ